MKYCVPSEIIEAATRGQYNYNPYRDGNEHHAWAALNDGHVVAVVLMNEYHHASMAEALAAAGRVQWCKSAARSQQRMNDERFLAHRTAARAHLATLGTVVSGTVCGAEFWPNAGITKGE